MLKIKSWTGNEVEARAFMDIDTPNGVQTISRIEDGEIICINDWLTDWAFKPEQCTMLHCPFKVGDEVQEYMNSADDWGASKVMTAEMLEDDLSFYRHASPDLRDSPDYTEEKV